MASKSPQVAAVPVKPRGKAAPVPALQVLITAIKEKRRVALRYRDQERARVVEPHAIYTSENREIVADCYQVRGYSAGGRPAPFWRPFRIKKIAEASLLDEAFSPRFREGFVPEKVRYRAGLLAMVSYSSPPTAAEEFVGPTLPAGRR